MTLRIFLTILSAATVLSCSAPSKVYSSSEWRFIGGSSDALQYSTSDKINASNVGGLGLS